MRFLNRWLIRENREKKNNSEFLEFELLMKNDMDNSVDNKNNL